MKEPSITINTIDETIGALVIPPDTRLNILCPVATPTGPTALTYVRSPAEFQRMFFGGLPVTPSSHATARYARALMNYAPMYVKRADNTKLRGGKTSNGLTFYTNKVGEPVESAKLAYFTSVNSDIVLYSLIIGSSKIYMNLLNEDDPTFPAIDGWLRLACSDLYTTSIPLSHFLKSVASYLRVPFIDNTMTLPEMISSRSDSISAPKTVSESRYNKILASGSVAGHYWVSVGDYCFTTDAAYNIPGKRLVVISEAGTSTIDLSKFYVIVLANLLSESPKPDNITELPSFTITGISAGASDYLYNNIPLNETGYFYIGDGDTITPLLTSENLTGTITTPSSSINVTEMNPLEALIALVEDRSGSISGSVGFGWNNQYTVIFSKSLTGLVSYSTTTKNSYSYIFNSDEDNIKNRKYSNLSIIVTIDGVTHAFYIGSAPSATNLYKISESDMSFADFVESSIRSMGSNLESSALSGEARVLIPNASNVTSTGLTTTLTDVTLSSTAKFGILPKFPSTSAMLTMNYSILPEDERVYRVTVTFGTLSETWEFSFDDTLIDGLGNSLYYQRVNDQSELIDIIELGGSQAPGLPSINFGNEVRMLEVTDSDIGNALLEISDKDESDIYFDFILDGSVSTMPVSGAILQLMEKYYSFYPVSCDPTATNEASIIAHRENLGINNAKANYIMFGHRSGVLGGASIKLPGSFYYMLNVLGVANGSQEFRSTFGSVNGAVAIDNPIQTFTKDTRERLLDHQIVTLIRGSSGYYFNLNQTLQKTLSYLSEDNIARMDNKIKQISAEYAKSLIAKKNSDSTRKSVESTLSLQLNSRLRAGTDNGPSSIRVQCDETNNPTSLINQRQIYYATYAQYSPSIKEVLVDSRVVPLS